MNAPKDEFIVVSAWPAPCFNSLEGFNVGDRSNTNFQISYVVAKFLL